MGKEGFRQTKFFLVVVVVVVAAYLVSPGSEDSTGNLVRKVPIVQPHPVCGDALFSAPEECEDCNTRSNDGCSLGCKVEYCGDGIIQPTWETCDKNTGCSANTICDPEVCRNCISLQGKQPRVSVTASPASIKRTGNVLFSISATDPDDLMTGYKICPSSMSLSCGGSAGGGGCTNFVSIPPTGSYTMSYSRFLSANTQSTSDTHIETIVFFDQKGNKGAASVVVPMYK
ncbi:MAG: DUF4215 domain-containing protein [Nanoarchaeota archaeon]